MFCLIPPLPCLRCLPAGAISPRVKSRVRLQAAWSLVQLATVDKFSDVIATNFIILALTVQVCSVLYCERCYFTRFMFL